MQDSANDPLSTASRHSLSGSAGARGYYRYGKLLWLDVDMLLRERTNGRRSVDDFARSLFTFDSGNEVTTTYGFDDVVTTLQSIVRYDWRPGTASPVVGDPFTAGIFLAAVAASPPTPVSLSISDDAYLRTVTLK